MGGSSERAAAILDGAQRTTYHEEDGNIVLKTYQDVQGTLDYCAKYRRCDAENRGTFGKRKDWRQTMSVPFNVMLGIAQQLGIPAGKALLPEYSKRIMLELKKPEYKNFRCVTDKRL